MEIQDAALNRPPPVPLSTFEQAKRRCEIATAVLAAMIARPGSTVDIDGERIGQQRVRTAIALADTLLAELAKGE